MNRRKKRNLCRHFNMMITLSFIVVCMFNLLQPVYEYSELENRYLQKMPKFSFSTLKNGSFMSETESYVNDHFIGRNFFIKLKSFTEYLTGKKENNNVLICDNGYLMERPSKIDQEVINQNIDAVKALNDVGRYNVNVSVIPPDYEVMRESLPNNAYENTILTFNGMLENAFTDTNIQNVNMTELLRSHKDEYLYYRTDHHMTSNGCFVAYYGLAETLGYTPLAVSDFKISEVTRSFMGTTYSRALKQTTPDTITDYRPLETGRFKVEFPYDNKESDSMYFPEHLQKKDKYSYFLDGNHALSVITSPNKNGKKLVVFKDSYAHGIMPFVANHFESIHMIDLRYYNDDVIAYLADNEISDVLFLYSASTFMTDATIQKVGNYAKTSPALLQKHGRVSSSKPVNDSYFRDAAFIGDSLTDGFRVYANLPDAKFLCGTSMTISGLSSREAPGGGIIMGHIKQGNYKKVYIMLGTNENIVEGYQDSFMKKYEGLIDTVKQYNPDAIVYIQSILPVTAAEEKTSYLKNDVIDNYNQRLEDLATKKQCYYLDIASVLKNDRGELFPESTTDGVHLIKDYYLRWLEYIKNHTVSATEAESALVAATEDENVVTDFDVRGIAANLAENISFRDTLSELSRSVVCGLYGVDKSMVANSCAYAGGGATAEEIVVIEAADEKNISAIEQSLKDHLENRRNSFLNYIPQEIPKIDNPYFYKKGKLIVLVVADGYNNVEDMIKQKS